VNQKVENCFLISHLKKAIWNLECANKLHSNTIDENIIEELKTLLLVLKVKIESEEKND
jgi:hypothetical protein